MAEQAATAVAADTTQTGQDNTQNGSNGQANAQKAADNNQKPADTPKKLKALKLKVDGQEYEEQLPFEVDESNKEQVEFLKRHLQMSKAASKRMTEAATTKKQAEQFIAALQQDPMRVLSNPQIMGEEKFRQIAEQFLTKKLQEQMMSPEQRAQAEMQEKLRQFEERDKKAKEDAEAAQMSKLQEHYTQEYQKVIIGALETSNLPRNPFTVKRMASLMQTSIKNGLELEPAQLATLVREDYQKELVALIGSSSPEQIIALFGDELTNKLRKHDLAKLKGSLVPPVAQQRTEAPPARKPQKPMTRDEWRAHLEERVKG